MGVYVKDELVPVLERFGQLYELRLMMGFNGVNRGYCFATYTTRSDAKRAARELNDFEIRNRRYLGACLSVDNCRLFVGGIPRTKQREVNNENIPSRSHFSHIPYPTIVSHFTTLNFDLLLRLLIDVLGASISLHIANTA